MFTFEEIEQATALAQAHITPQDIEEAAAAPLTDALAQALKAQFQDPDQGDFLHEVLVAQAHGGVPSTDLLMRAAALGEWATIQIVLKEAVTAATPYLKARAMRALRNYSGAALPSAA